MSPLLYLVSWLVSAEFSKFIGPFSAELRLGFISCLPRLWWWSQICGLGRPLTSFSSFPSFLHPWLAFCFSPHLASVLLGGTQRSRRMSAKKNATSTVFLFARVSRQIACLFNPCAHRLCPSVKYRPTGCTGGADGHLGWLTSIVSVFNPGKSAINEFED